MPVLSKETHILVADEAWVALATLHRKHPQRGSFSPREILDQVKLEHANPELRAGVQAHIYLHNVANVEPNSARYRMFYRERDDTYRLYRADDSTHPRRKGKITPNRSELPEKYHELLDWYDRKYSKGASKHEAGGSIFDRMWGLGKHLWTGINPDDYVAELRAGWDQPGLREKHASLVTANQAADASSLAERIWRRIVTNQGEEFHTKTGLPFTYQVEGKNGILFNRAGRWINKRLSRKDVEKAIRKCPLEDTAEIKECFDPAYLFAILMDPRIRGSEW